MKEIIRSYKGKFGRFEIDLYNGKIIQDNLNRDKIWKAALKTAKKEYLDPDAEQGRIYIKIFDDIFTEDLIEHEIDWLWRLFKTGIAFDVKTPIKQYTLIVVTEGSFIIPYQQE